eukprot:5090902-Amphidinium_carterae.1
MKWTSGTCKPRRDASKTLQINGQLSVEWEPSNECCCSTTQALSMTIITDKPQDNPSLGPHTTERLSAKVETPGCLYLYGKFSSTHVVASSSATGILAACLLHHRNYMELGETAGDGTDSYDSTSIHLAIAGPTLARVRFSTIAAALVMLYLQA